MIPLGVFVVFHLARQARALGGSAAFAKRSALAGAPMLVLAAVVLVPLAFHAVYGAFLTIRKLPLRDESPYTPALARAMRVTGLLALAYVAYHVYEYAQAIGAAGLTPMASYTLVASKLSSSVAAFPVRAIVEVCGQAIVLFHLCVGLWGLSVSNGWVASRAARRWSAIAFSALGAVAFFVAFDTIVLFTTGARLIGNNDPTPIELVPSQVACPASASAHESR